MRSLSLFYLLGTQMNSMQVLQNEMKHSEEIRQQQVNEREKGIAKWRKKYV
jgi:hypothetical protein